MAAKEMYDYVSRVLPSTTWEMSSVPCPQKILTEKGLMNQVIHLGDDGSEERIGLATPSVFYVTLRWDALSPGNSGVIMDFYFNSDRANGRLETFHWTHPTDGHTYVARFDCDFQRPMKPRFVHQVKSVRLKVLGSKTD